MTVFLTRMFFVLWAVCFLAYIFEDLLGTGWEKRSCLARGEAWINNELCSDDPRGEKR